MDSAANAALRSWVLDPRVIFLLLLTGGIYLRGWLRGRQLLRHESDGQRLCTFLGGLAAIFLATQSPLDAFDSLFLSAHMAQHLLMMMVAPPLLLLGHPVLPLLRGLPKPFVKEALGPFLAWPALRRVANWLVSPPVAWLAFAISTIAWHMPKLYQLALSSPSWHEVQHASFFWTGILFWWPVIQPGPGKPKWPRWVAIPYLALADLVNTALSAFFIFSGKLLYPAYEAVRVKGLSAADDQTLAGAIMWVPGSIVYIIPAIAIAMSLFSTHAERQIAPPVRVKRHPQTQPSLTRWQLWHWRRVAQAVMLLIAIAVMADGFFGPQVTPLNLSGILPWIHWRALTIVALLAVGNLFCMACPFTFVRDLGRRILPARFRWPRPLRTKWLAATLLVVYFWAYEAYGLWDSPWLTAWLIAGYFTAALLVDGLFRGASFCKYVCPIGQFNFVSSLISPREVAVRSQAVCKACRTHDCIKGNAHTRGCELYLFQPKKASSLDCTFCLDCVKACPHDNVALLPVLPAKTLLSDPYRSSLGRLSKRTDVAMLALVFVFGAFVNASGMIDPVMRWEHSWHARLGIGMMPVIIAGFVFTGTLLLPTLLISLCAALNRLAGLNEMWTSAARRFTFSLVPIGFAMWAAHVLYHFATGWDAPVAIVQRLVTGAVTRLPTPFVPDWLTSAQIVLLDAGLLLTLYIVWRIANQLRARTLPAIAILAPWAVLSCSLYVLGVVVLLEPMQMRGMMMH